MFAADGSVSLRCCTA